MNLRLFRVAAFLALLACLQGACLAGSAQAATTATQSQQIIDAAIANPELGKELLKARAVVVDIDSETLDFDKAQNAYIATGKVHVIISEQNTDLVCDEVIYDQNKDMMFAKGHVTITRNGQKTFGTYAKIDLTHQSALIQDPLTSIDKIRVRAKHMLVNNTGIRLENGRYVLDRLQLIGSLMGQQYTRRDDLNPNAQTTTGRLNAAYNPLQALQQQALDLDAQAQQEQPGVEFNDGMDSLASKIRIHVDTLDVRRGADNVDEIIATRPSIYFGKHRLFKLGIIDSLYDETAQQLNYVGPDMGFDPNYGGWYWGPGWDARVGKTGAFRVSPLLTFGSGINLKSSSSGSGIKAVTAGPGIGIAAHYRDKGRRMDFVYGTKNDVPMFYAEQKLFDSGKTRFQISKNDDYTGSVLGMERPGFVAQIRDHRQLAEWGNMGLFSYVSAGVARDNVNPNSVANFFVEKKSADPVTAGRLQLQAEMHTLRPLLSIGEWMNAGFSAQSAFSAYTSGDAQAILRAGPSIGLNLGKRWMLNAQYYATARSGDTPFVFDSYYQGAHSVQLSNTVRVNKYLDIGWQQQMNLNKDNSRGDLLTGNTLFVMIGPRDVKLMLGFDMVQQRTYFGFNIAPGEGKNPIDFDTMRMYQPQQLQGS